MKNRLHSIACALILLTPGSQICARPQIKVGVLSISNHAMRPGPCPSAQFTAFIRVPAVVTFPDSARYVRIAAGDIKSDPQTAWNKLEDDEGGGGVSSLNPYHVNLRKIAKTSDVIRVVVFFEDPKRWRFYIEPAQDAASDDFDGIAYSDVADFDMFCEEKQSITNVTYRTFTFKDPGRGTDRHGSFNIGIQLRKRFGAMTPIILDPKAKNDGTDD